MRVAALCDVHGNLPALEAVLAEVRVARRRPDRLRRRRRRGPVSRRTASTGSASVEAVVRPRQRRPRVAAGARRARGSGSRRSSTSPRTSSCRTLPMSVVARRRPLLPRLAARRRRDPDQGLAGRALPGRARRASRSGSSSAGTRTSSSSASSTGSASSTRAASACRTRGGRARSGRCSTAARSSCAARRTRSTPPPPRSGRPTYPNAEQLRRLAARAGGSRRGVRATSRACAT